MKTATGLLATALLIGGVATAQAQGTSTPMSTPSDQNQGVERNPNGAPGGSVTNPSTEGGAGGAVREREGTTGSGAGQMAPNVNQTNPVYPNPSVRSGSSPGR